MLKPHVITLLLWVLATGNLALSAETAAPSSAPTDFPLNLKSVFVAEGALSYCASINALPASYVESVLSDFRNRAPGYRNAARGLKDKAKLIGEEKIKKEGKHRERAACKVFTHVVIERVVRKQTPIDESNQFKLLAEDPVRFDEQLLYNNAFCAGYFDVFGFGIKGDANKSKSLPMLQKLLIERDILKARLKASGIDEDDKAMIQKGKEVAISDLKSGAFGLPAKRVRMCQSLL